MQMVRGPAHPTRRSARGSTRGLPFFSITMRRSCGTMRNQSAWLKISAQSRVGLWCANETTLAKTLSRTRASFHSSHDAVQTLNDAAGTSVIARGCAGHNKWPYRDTPAAPMQSAVRRAAIRGFNLSAVRLSLLAAAADLGRAFCLPTPPPDCGAR